MNYAELKPKSQIAADILAVAQGQDPWMDYYNFQAKVVPPEIVAKDLFMLELAQQHPFVMGVLKMDPNTVYNWHADSRRGCTINMLLTYEDISHCLFSDDPTGVQCNTKELHYRPSTYYLFNTQHQHMVVNGGDTRYLASLEFAEGQDLTFDILLEEFQKYQLLAQG
jgi:hypothetical protein